MLHKQSLNNSYRPTLNQINVLLILIAIFYTQMINANPASSSINYSKERFYYSSNIIIEVEHFKQAIKAFEWLDLIRLTETGMETFNAIEMSGHQLLIYHSPSALLSAGVTGAPLSQNLTNGIGESVYIKFYLDMEDYGSNCVLGESGSYIHYSALHNLMHELVHARHKMNGTWLYFDSEGQAIREENKFRIDWATYRSTSYSLRYDDPDDEAIIMSQNGHCAISNIPEQ
ncbi:hypothetical protein [Aliikangiella sp. IMCC44359]|uniref:hypothetical protein n=1 Tax=Aliikangiella sp. IMCC44359 TaxID=3459125 RepID=UPI00403AD365